MSIEIEDLLKQVRKYMTEKDLAKVYEAYVLAERLHSAGPPRESGEPYIIHPLFVAHILSKIHADCDTICAALLHDTIEDTDITKEEIARRFNGEIAELVDGVTKMKTLDYKTKDEAERATIRKIIVGMMEDPRILYIKLADRLHNMRTLQHKKNVLRQREFAIETLDYFVPLAYAVGAYDIKIELEDLALKFAMPEEYNYIDANRTEISKYGQELFQEMLAGIDGVLTSESIPHKVKYKVKSVYRLYKELQNNNKFSDIQNLFSMQVIVDSIRNCYITLGIIHNLDGELSKYKPDNDYFKDLICSPKSNLYQSIHTTLIGPRGKSLQAQIRTERMHNFARNGIGGHWLDAVTSVKEKMKTDLSTKMPIFRAVNEIDRYYTEDAGFVEQIKKEGFANYIFVQTADQEIIDLPVGATVLDFAYKIHSAIGNKFLSATVNDVIVPIDYVLSNHEQVKIMTSSEVEGPFEYWEGIVQTTRAKRKIREALRKRYDKEDRKNNGWRTY